MDDAMKAHVDRTRRESSHNYVPDNELKETLDKLVEEKVVLKKPVVKKE